MRSSTLLNKSEENSRTSRQKNQNGKAPAASLHSPIAQLYKLNKTQEEEKTNLNKAKNTANEFTGQHLSSATLAPTIKSKSSSNPIQRASSPMNSTGLPDKLKSGVEQLSGISLDDVKVHYNSKQPASLKAHAYAQGTDIHIASGQEKHLPHETWHVIQQKQGRVQPTKQVNNNVNVNDNDSLENEATQMGNKAMNYSNHEKKSVQNQSSNTNSTAQLVDDEEEKYKEPSLFEKAKHFIKGDRSGALLKTGTASVKAAQYGVQGLSAADFARESAMSAAGTVTAASKVSGIGGGVIGGLSMVKSAYDFHKGNQQRIQANKFLDDEANAKNLSNAELTQERAKQRIAATQGKDKMRDSSYGFVSGGLSMAGGIGTATGIAAPIGLGLSAASMAVTGAGMLHGMAVQHGRDKDARRVRGMDEIASDRINKNKAREDRIAGSNWNPLNWGAKLSRATGILDSDEKKIGTGLLDNDKEATEKYTKGKRDKYASEGYNYDNFDGKGAQDKAEHEKNITKSKQTGGSWNPLHWGEGSTTETKSIDQEDIMVKKGLSSKEVNKKKHEELRKKSWFSW